MRAQIERAFAAGLSPTNLHAHVAAAMSPELLDAHVRLAEEFGLAPILPRSIEWAPDPDRYGACVNALDEAGAPVVDHCRGKLAVDRDALEEGWRSLVADLPPGLTHLALQCTAPVDIAVMSPAHDLWRTGEHALIASGFVRDLWAAHDSAITSTRAL